VRADTNQAKKQLKPTWVRGVVGHIRNPAKIVRLEEGVWNNKRAFNTKKAFSYKVRNKK
jgi:hypothetical protein